MLHARLRATLGLSASLLLLGLGACSTDAGESTEPPIGADDVVVPDVEEEIPDPITVRVVASVKEGNAPLAVNLECEVTGEDPSKLQYEWDIAGTPSKVPALDWTFTSIGDKNVCCSAWRPERPDDQAKHCEIIRVRNTPALAVGEPAISGPTSVGPKDCLKVSTAVINKGGRVFEPMEVACALSTKETWDPADGAGQIAIWSSTIDSLKDGKAVPQRVEFPDESMCVPEGTADGSYYLLCKVDATDLLIEDDETDNVRFAASLVTVSGKLGLKPDLSVGSLALQAGQTFPKNWGQNVGYVVQIGNSGDGAAESAFAYRVEVCPEGTAPGSEKCQLVIAPEQSNIVSLEAGKTITIQRSWTIPTDLPDGRYCFDAAVDVNDTQLESNESNNTLADPTACFEVKYSVVGGVDLNLVAVTCSPSEAAWNGTLLANLTVRNDGTMDTGEWDLEIELTDKPAPNGLWKLCGTKSDCKKRGSLAPGQETLIQIVVTVSGEIPLKDYTCWGRLDSGDALDELNESNNNLKAPSPVTVVSKSLTDVYMKDVSFTPSSVKAGQTIDVTYTMGNQNKSTAAGVAACVVLSTDDKFTVSDVNAKKDIVIDEVIVNEVPPDSKQAPVPVTRTVTLPLALDHNVTTWKVGALADCKGLLTDDTVKTNNGLVATPSDLTVSDAQGGCFEDTFEPNGAGVPATIASGPTASLGLCDGADSYSITVGKAETLTVGIDVQPIQWIASLNPPVPDLEMRLFDPAGVLVDSAKLGQGTASVIAYVVPEDGVYRVEVVAQKTANRAHYALDIQAAPPVDGIDLVATEVVTSPATTFPGGALHLDWKLVSAGDTAAGPFSVGLYFSTDTTFEAETDRRVGTLTFTGAPAANSEKRHDILVLPTDLAGGSYSVFVRVDDGASVTEVVETNNVAQGADSIVDAANPCVDDPIFEPNNSLDVATALPAETAKYADLGVCPDLDDWYRLDLTQGQTVTAKVTYTYSSKAGNLYVQLVDRNGVALVEGTATTNPSAVLPYIWETGAYYVRVYNPKKTASSLPYKYGLDLTIGAGAAADACAGDVYEANNDAASAAQTGCGLRKATLCLKDKDWYTFKLPPSTSVGVTLTNEGSDFKMTLFTDPKGNSVGKTTGNGAIPITAPADKWETYYLLVESKVTTSSATDSFDYELFFDGLTGVDLEVVGLKTSTGKAYQGEDEQLNFTIANQCLDPVVDAEFAIYLSSDAVLDPADTLVELQPTGPIAAGGELALTQKFTVPPGVAPGVYSVLVSADPAGLIAESNEDNNTSAAPFTVQKVCVDDASEPNNTGALAAIIGKGTSSGLQVCPFDADWYRVTVDWPSRQLAVDLDFSLAAGGDLDLRLYDAPGATVPVAKAYTSSEGERLLYKVPVNGNYWLRVNGLSGATNAYSLTVSAPACGDGVCAAGVEDCATCPDDCGSTYCDDGKVCTADVCTPDGGAPEGYVCSNPFSAGPCDDGIACNGADSCGGGVCVSGTGNCDPCADVELPTTGVVISLIPTASVAGIDVDGDSGTCAPAPCTDGLDNALGAYVAAFTELVQAHTDATLRLVIHHDGSELTLYRAKQKAGGLTMHPDSLGPSCAPRAVFEAGAPVGEKVTAVATGALALSLRVGIADVAVGWRLASVTYDTETGTAVIAGSVTLSDLTAVLDEVAFASGADYPAAFDSLVLPDLDIDGDNTPESVSVVLNFNLEI